MQDKLPISLVVITYNDADNLEKMILKHKHIVSEVIVVDQSSTDRTPEVCVKLADKTFIRRRKGTSDPDRNWAFALGDQPYVLYLDTDEYLSEEALQLLPEIIKADFDCVWFKRKNLVDGVDIYEILKDDIQLRLFKRGSVRFPSEIHHYPEAANNVNVLHAEVHIIHERTLVGMIKAHKAREIISSKKLVDMQNQFLKYVKALVEGNRGFTENWYSSSQLESLKDACLLVKNKELQGSVIEIGCWEGKSTCTIANTLPNDEVIAVDTWEGNTSEGPEHPSVVAAKTRDVLAKFKENVKQFTKGNVIPTVSDCFKFLEDFKGFVKFAHIDAGHDYASVKRTIEMLKPFLVKGAVLCGDDFMSANKERKDLGGGVEQAVIDTCPGFESQENFWYWVNK